MAKFKECHVGPVHALTIGDGVEIWAGSLAEINGRLWDLRLCLGISTAKGTSLLEFLGGAKAMLPSLDNIKPLPVLYIPWADFATPNLHAGSWEALYSDLAMLPPSSKIGIHCQGGHGRTGTALAILTALSGTTALNDCVRSMRKVYCRDGVESNAQLDYIEDMTGARLKDKPAKTFTTTTYGAAQDQGWEVPERAGWSAGIFGIKK